MERLNEAALDDYAVKLGMRRLKRQVDDYYSTRLLKHINRPLLLSQFQERVPIKETWVGELLITLRLRDRRHTCTSAKGVIRWNRWRY
jgi:hypothetical protein